jgi:AcrR family transcriptional regulator
VKNERQPPKPTRRRSKANHDQGRRELLQHAWDIYRAQGLEGLTVRAVTQAMGMSPMAFYSYFPSKQALVQALWVDIYQELLDLLLAAGRDSRSPVQTMRAHAEAYIAYWEQHPEHYRLVFGAIDAGDDEFTEIRSEPVYSQAVELARERVVACAGGAEVAQADSTPIVGLMIAKAIGYLQVRTSATRIRIAATAQFRQMVIDDIVSGAERAVLAAAGAPRAALPRG